MYEKEEAHLEYQMYIYVRGGCSKSSKPHQERRALWNIFVVEHTTTSNKTRKKNLY